MTTIAYKRGVLASDSLRTSNGLRDGMATKVWKSPKGATFYALGSGYQIAMGAMEMGADARAAVRCAIKHDTGSGGRIQAVSLRGTKR